MEQQLGRMRKVANWNRTSTMTIIIRSTRMKPKRRTKKCRKQVRTAGPGVDSTQRYFSRSGGEMMMICKQDQSKDGNDTRDKKIQQEKDCEVDQGVLSKHLHQLGCRPTPRVWRRRLPHADLYRLMFSVSIMFHSPGLVRHPPQSHAHTQPRWSMSPVV